MERVLLIEDKPEIRNRIGRELRRHGYKAIMASDGAEGLEKILADDRDYDCVITDIDIPVMDGVDLLRYLKRWRNDLPVINYLSPR